MTTLLVTGAQGYVGRYLTRELLARRADATVIGSGRSPREGDVLERYSYVRADILDADHMRELFGRYRPERIFHLAAAPSHGSRIEIAQTNVVGTMTLLDAIVSVDNYHPRVVIGSSGGVYGALDDDHLPASESAPCVPVDILGASKVAAEHMSRIVGERHGVCVMAARIFNVCGPGQERPSVDARFVAKHGVGDATRDFIDVRDVATALALIGERGACGEAYNVSSGDFTLSGMPSVHRNYGDVTRLRELGFVQRHPVEDTPLA